MADTIPTASPRRILVVEDLEDSRESLQELLRTALQVEVDVAEDGLAALELLAARPYAVVITDLHMPKVSGMRLIREIANRKLACAVLVVTGHGGVREAVEAMRLGVSDFLTKPIDPQQFVMLVERILRERTGVPPPEGEDTSGARDGSEESVPLFDPPPPDRPATGS